MRFWTSAVDGTPVTASAQFVDHGVAGFSMGVTLPAGRRAGHWWRHVQLRLATEPDLWHVVLDVPRELQLAPRREREILRDLRPAARLHALGRPSPDAAPGAAASRSPARA